MYLQRCVAKVTQTQIAIAFGATDIVDLIGVFGAIGILFRYHNGSDSASISASGIWINPDGDSVTPFAPSLDLTAGSSLGVGRCGTVTYQPNSKIPMPFAFNRLRLRLAGGTPTNVDTEIWVIFPLAPDQDPPTSSPPLAFTAALGGVINLPTQPFAPA